MYIYIYIFTYTYLHIHICKFIHIYMHTSPYKQPYMANIPPVNLLEMP